MITSEERRKYEEEQIRKDYENKDRGGSGKGVLDFSLIGGYRKDLFWRPTTENKYNSIDFMQFIATEKNPNKVPTGMPAYKLQVSVHRYVGPEEGTFLCLQKMYGKPCPICEEAEILRQDTTTKKGVLDKLKPKERVYYVILDKNSTNKFQIFEESYYLFQDKLLVAAGAGGRYVTFQSLENGKTVEFLAIKTTKPSSDGISYTFNEYQQFNFIDRKPYDERIYAQVYPLDKMLIIPTYEEVSNAYYGFDGDQTAKQPHVQGIPVNNPVQEAESLYLGGVDPVAVAMENGGVVPQEQIVTTSGSQVDTNTGEVVNQCPDGYEFGKQTDEFQACAICPKEIYDKCNKIYQASRG